MIPRHGGIGSGSLGCRRRNIKVVLVVGNKLIKFLVRGRRAFFNQGDDGMLPALCGDERIVNVLIFGPSIGVGLSPSFGVGC